jgi:hypothetical protein
MITQLKSFTIQVLTTSNKILTEYAIYFPNAAFTAFMINAWFSLFSASYFLLAGLAIHGYFIYNMKNYLVRAIECYNEMHISELESTYEKKHEYIPIIKAVTKADNLVEKWKEKISNFLSFQ